jgi:lipoprotein-anchoring transpeptidase ErfK/SrfK
MKGITKYGDFSDHAVQRYKSTVSDGAPWVLMRWIDDPRDPTNFIGKLPAENASGFTAGLRTALAWSDYSLKIRIPWTMLNVYEPTQMKVIDGAVTTDGGNSFMIFPAISDGIAVSVYCKGSVTSSTSRYKWQTWTYVPPYKIREKKSLQIVEDGLKSFSSFIN